MLKKTAISLGLLSAIWMIPLQAEDFSKFSFNIGGGMSTPLNPTGQYVGLSGNFVAGAGYNVAKHHNILAEFMWNGLPSNNVVHLPNAPYGSMNLYTLTTNYRYHTELGTSPFGVYAMGGGGWYYRYASIDKNYTVPPTSVCAPIYYWWGYGCDTGGYVVTETLASKGNSTGGLNAGVGLTIKLSDSGWKFYVESRYHYAWSNRVPTTVVPVTFGFRFN